MYILIDEHTIQEYNNEILTKGVGKKVIQTISNPTELQLREFGYKSLVEEEQPEYNPETQYLEAYYNLVGEDIVKSYQVNDIPVEEVIEETPIEEPIEEIQNEEETPIDEVIE